MLVHLEILFVLWLKWFWFMANSNIFLENSQRICTSDYAFKSQILAAFWDAIPESLLLITYIASCNLISYRRGRWAAWRDLWRPDWWRGYWGWSRGDWECPKRGRTACEELRDVRGSDLSVQVRVSKTSLNCLSFHHQTFDWPRYRALF